MNYIFRKFFSYCYVSCVCFCEWVAPILSYCLRAFTFDTCNFLAQGVHSLWKELVCNLIVSVNIYLNFASIWTIWIQSFTLPVVLLKPALCGPAWRFFWSLNISVIKSPCRLVKSRRERDSHQNPVHLNLPQPCFVRFVRFSDTRADIFNTVNNWYGQK